MKKFMITISSEKGEGIFPMKLWLRQNPSYIPHGMNPSTNTSHELFRKLKNLGWAITESNDEIRLSKPQNEGSQDSNHILNQSRGVSSTKLTAQVVGNMGLYYVCYQLSRLGWNAMPTARNARGIDIIAYNRTCSRAIGVQVKSLSKRDPVPLGRMEDKLLGDFWIIVNDLLQGPKIFVLLPSEVRSLAHRGERDGKVSYWLQPSSYCVDEFLEAWGRIGRGDIPV